MSKINVTRSSMPPFEEYCDEIRSLWDTRWLTNNGQKHQELTARLQDYLDSKAVVLATNGHLALELAIKALVPEGEVITTPFTFASTTQAIVRCGLKPVFCDIDPVTFTIDPTKIEELINKNTRAIVPVHVYGSICNVEAIEAIAKKHDLKVIYDAAHAFGITYRGKSIASYGDASMFSFHATKVFHTIEGGCVSCQDEALAQKMNVMKNFGLAAEDDVPYAGGNAKMSDFQAAMGLCNLRHIDEEIGKRKRATEHYLKRLGQLEGLTFKPEQAEVVSNYAYFPIFIDAERFGMGREGLSKELQEHEIFARRYFYPLTNTFACYDQQPQETPIAKAASECVLSLPLYADISTEEIDRICDVIITAHK